MIRPDYATMKDQPSLILGEVYSYIFAWTGPFVETTSSDTPLAGSTDEAASKTTEVRDEIVPTSS